MANIHTIYKIKEVTCLFFVNSFQCFSLRFQSIGSLLQQKSLSIQIAPQQIVIVFNDHIGKFRNLVCDFNSSCILFDHPNFTIYLS